MNHDRIMSYAEAHGATIPTRGSQCEALLESMFDGEKFTVGDAMSKLGIYALSQRAGDLKFSGWPVKSDWVTVPSGKRVKMYWLEA
jgi:hypothetical protein